jgi:hypothetical protein
MPFGKTSSILHFALCFSNLSGFCLLSTKQGRFTSRPHNCRIVRAKGDFGKI